MLKNNNIDNLILSSDWLIDFNWGIKQLSKYFNDVSLIESGFSIKDLNYESTKLKSSLILINEQSSINQDKENNRYINYLSIIGVMQTYGGWCSYGARDWSSWLLEEDKKEKIVAHIIDIDSGGGSASAGVMMYETLKTLKKPVYVIGSLIGSAAYLTALPAKKIYLKSDFSEAGSIGVMISLDKEFLEWYKENIVDFYSKKSPDKNFEWNELLKGNTAPLLEHLDETAELFHSKVLLERSGVDKKMLKGSMVKASRAIETGLVDGIKSLTELIEEIGNDLELNTSDTESVIEFEEYDEELKTINNMTLFERIANQLLRVLNISVASTEEGMQDAATQLEAMQPLNEQITAATNALTDKVSNLETRLVSALNEIASAKQANVELTSKLTDLEFKVDELSQENKNLSERILGYENEGSGDNSKNNQFNSIEQFNTVYNGFITVE